MWPRPADLGCESQAELVLSVRGSSLGGYLVARVRRRSTGQAEVAHQILDPQLGGNGLAEEAGHGTNASVRGLAGCHSMG